MVSICIPTYNNAELFKKCLDSVITQDFKDYEIIVSDDSTNDAIKNYVKEINLPGLVYLRNQPPLGSPANWNNCMLRANRKYIKMLHHDDYFATKDALSKFVYSLENNPGASFSFCYSLIHFKKQDKFYVHRQTATQLRRVEDDASFLFYRNVIGSPSATFFKNDRSLLFDEQYKWLVDVDFYLRYLAKYPDFINIPEALVTTVDGAAGQVTQDVSNNGNLVITEHIKRFSTIFSEKTDHKRAYLFFGELFMRFNIGSYDDLKDQFEIPTALRDFMKATFEDLKKNTLLKRIKKRLLTSRYNKLIFKIERF